MIYMSKRVRFYLGTVSEQRQFLFTELGAFSTPELAQKYWSSKIRNGHAYVFRHEDLYRFGVNYGTCCKIVATAIGKPLEQ